MPFFQKIFSDDFNRPDESPLNPANWGLFTDPQFVGLQVVSNTAQTILFSSPVTDGGEMYIGQTLAADQYAEATIGPEFDLSADAYAEIDVVVRTTSNVSQGLALAVFSNQDGTAALEFDDVAAQTDTPIFNSFVPQIGDRLKIAAIGSAVYCYYNDVLVYQTTTASTTGGQPALVISTNGDVSDSAQVSYFEAGLASIFADVSVIHNIDSYVYLPKRVVPVSLKVPTKVGGGLRINTTVGGKLIVE